MFIERREKLYLPEDLLSLHRAIVAIIPPEGESNYYFHQVK
jgi:hypothetical protein